MQSHGAKDKQAHRKAFWSWTTTLPTAVAESWSGRLASWQISRKLRANRQSLRWDHTAARNIRFKLKHILSSSTRLHSLDPLSTLPAEEQYLVQHIQEATADANRSNVTRTQAYYDCYEAYPELHWALLAHMVSRNAGWNMSDLQGGLMSDLIDPKFKHNLYRFLERCNALIFQDAYPQLLLYMHSRKRGKPLFHLLPIFRVSVFMGPCWEQFWLERCSSLLTVALIVNEQNYIEGRVAKHPYYRSHILEHPHFRIHELARLNQIIFPLGETHGMTDTSDPASSHSMPLPSRPLAGLTIPKFADLAIRIKAGKSLYALLFGYEDIYHSVSAFARSTRHQGSRAEYWPDLFTSNREKAMNNLQESGELLKSEWLPDGHQLYSPCIEEIWHDEPPEPIPRYDWYEDSAMLKFIRKPLRPLLPDITHAHRAALEKTSIAHDVSEKVHHFLQ